MDGDGCVTILSRRFHDQLEQVKKHISVLDAAQQVRGAPETLLTIPSIVLVNSR